MEDKIKKLEKNLKKYKILCVILVIIIIVILCLTFYFGSQTKQIAEVEHQNTELQYELDSILREYEAIKSEYGDLNTQLSERDSSILAQAEEIKVLIASQADYRRIKKKLELLQDQGKEYVRMLDSLYVVNQQLTEENIEIKQTVTRLSTEKQTLTQEKENLEEKVTTAAKMKAYNISLKGMNLKSGGKKEEETNKARRVKKLKVNFTLGENTLAPSGDMNIYARISLPDGRVLVLGKGDGYSFTNDGKQLQYTIKSTVNYDQKTMPVEMVWDLRSGDVAVTGEYIVQLFTETDYIGQARMVLE
jgi:peptidoglycan hydrolase CwlO-like protein